MRLARLASAVLVLLPAVAPAALPSRPVEQWRWEGARDGFGAPAPDSTPLVVQLTDDDGDGRVTGADTPDVVFLHYGMSLDSPCGARLTVLDGATGVEHVTIDEPAFGTGVFAGGSGLLAAADLDADGRVEILVTDLVVLHALHADGTIAWSRPWPRVGQSPCAQGPYALGAALSIADLDLDGVPEIIHYDSVLSADGSLEWTGGAGGDFQDYTSFSVAADVDAASPGLELIAGNTCYSARGAVLWHDDTLPEGAVAVGDVDGDGDPEIALAYVTELFLLDHRGRRLLPDSLPLGFFSLLPPSVPVMAELDGSPGSEIVVAHQDRMHAFDWVGGGAGLAQMWVRSIDDPSCCAGATAFDFDGDGRHEIVYRDHLGLRIFDGATGAQLALEPFESGTGEEIPVVADIDGDCVAEIVVSGIMDRPGDAPHDSVIAYEVDGSRRARPLWNQQLYHVSNAGDDATVPSPAVAPWLVPGGGFLAQVAVDDCPACWVELSGAPPVARGCAGETVVLDASGVGLGGCGSGVTREWLHDGVPVGTGPTLPVPLGATDDFVVRVQCSGDPACRRDVPARAVVETGPLAGAATVVDAEGCSHGLALSWEPATFASGTGRYFIHRSDAGGGLSCADALARPPIAQHVFGRSYLDTTTVAGESYVYVVVAEDDSDVSRCAPGGPRGFSSTSTCLPAVADAAGDLPADAGPVLRATHAGDEVTLLWPTMRTLLSGEHVHVLKSSLDPRGPFARVNPEGDAGASHVETDTSAWLQFFDVRVASPCEDVSRD